jgi:hypothetical protein
LSGVANSEKKELPKQIQKQKILVSKLEDWPFINSQRGMSI